MKKTSLISLLILALFCFGHAEETYLFHGTHFIASYGDCNYEALTDIDSLREVLLLAAKESGASILSYVDYLFPGHGFTMAVLLSESHASIHTYPEHQACFVDLFTCGNHCSSVQFSKVLESYLQPKHISKKVLIRNECIEEEL
jgi:S-adenosylmethionine decarboxylase proenzyme